MQKFYHKAAHGGGSYGHISKRSRIPEAGKLHSERVLSDRRRAKTDENLKLEKEKQKYVENYKANKRHGM